MEQLENRKYYSRIAIGGLILALLRTIIQIKVPLFLIIITDILISVGLVAGIIWLFKFLGENNIKSNRRRDEWWKRLSSGKMDMVDWLEFDGHITPEASEKIKEKYKERKIN